MAHRPASLNTQESRESLVHYSALPGTAHTPGSGDNLLYHSSPPSAYEFSVFSRDSNLPEPTTARTDPDGGFKSWGGGGLKGRGSYQSLQSPEVRHKPSKKDGQPQSWRSWFAFWFSMVMGLLWIPPVVALVVLNVRGTIIGASAWCPGNYCPGLSDPGRSMADLRAQYDRDNHNLMGGLQFAAKAAEVWFATIAISLVWLLVSMLARSEHGLPIGYLSSYSEFTDPLYLVKPTLWTAALSAPLQRGHKHKRRTTRYWMFGLFVAFATIIVNLIGPLVAVLMIPTLNWVDMPKTSDVRFSKLLSSQPPSGDKAIAGCVDANFTAGRFGCTADFYGHSLDALFDYFLTEYAQSFVTSGNVVAFSPAPSQEQGLSIRFNFSSIESALSEGGSAVYWAPNRAVARALSKDLEDFYKPGPASPGTMYNNSLQLNLQRQGPIVGYTWSWIGTNRTITTVADDKEIRCYQHCYFDPDAFKPYAKCFRVGTGWNETNGIERFAVGHDSPPIDSPLNGNDITDQVNTTVYYADRAAWVQTTLVPDHDMPHCFPNGTAPKDCDYDKLFSDPVPAAIPKNLTEQALNSFVIEQNVANDSTLTLMVEGHYSLGFTTYSADVSSFSPMWGLINIDSFPDPNDPSEMRPLAVHPSWLLAAWSVGRNRNVPYTRVSARQLQLTSTRLHRKMAGTGVLFRNASDYDQVLWNFIAMNTGLQAASLIPYETTDPKSDGLTTKADDPVTPLLWYNVRRQVWGFNMDSRTAKLAVGVMGVAVILVLLRTVLMLATRIRHREIPELLIAAMKHHPRGEFEVAGEQPRQMERVRFEIKDDVREHIHFRKVD